MKYIKLCGTKKALDETICSIKHGDGAYVFNVKNTSDNLTFYNEIHPGPNCIHVENINMKPLKIDSSSIKQNFEIGDVLYSTLDGKLTLDETTDDKKNIAIAICVIPSVLENFEKGDQSDDAVETARFIALEYMTYDIEHLELTRDTDQENRKIMFGNYSVTIGNRYGDKTSCVGGKINTQKCLDKSYNQDSRLCNGITNNPGAGYCPAACSCVAYSTIGTKPGDWYLPSPGEMTAFINNKTLINNKKKQLNGTTFGNYYYWTCLEYNNNYNYCVHFSDPTPLWKGAKNVTAHVISFLSVSL